MESTVVMTNHVSIKSHGGVKIRNIYLISDIHANHEGIKKYEPWRDNNFEARVLDKIQQLPEDSILINLGDVVFKEPKIFLTRYRKSTQHLRSILVRGNHEHKSDNYYLDFFDYVCTWVALKKYGKEYIFTHIPIEDLKENQINYHGHTHGNHRLEEFKLTSNHRVVTQEIQILKE